MLGAGNQRNRYRIQHVFESVDLRRTEIEDAKSPAHFLPLYRDSMLLQSLHTQRHLPLYQHLLLELFHSEHEPTRTGGGWWHR